MQSLCKKAGADFRDNIDFRGNRIISCIHNTLLSAYNNAGTRFHLSWSFLSYKKTVKRREKDENCCCESSEIFAGDT